MGKRFSKTYGGFSEWKSQAGNTNYSRKIKRLHALHPQASLSQLRGDPGRGERALGSLKTVPPSKIDWSLLNPKEALARERSLQAIRLMRKRGYSLTKASRIVGTTPETVRRHTNAVKLDGTRYVPKAYDKVSREMNINTNGESIWIEVKDSRHAHTIGKYQNAVKLYLESGDDKYLKPFRNKRVRDSEGNYYTLETDPHTIHEIQERRVHEEFFTIYRPRED